MIDALAEKIKEIVIDATYGTNNAGIQLLFALVDLDGTGVPLDYLFVEKGVSSRYVSLGTLMQIYDQFFRHLYQVGFFLIFLDTTKLSRGYMQLKSRAGYFVKFNYVFGIRIVPSKLG